MDFVKAEGLGNDFIVVPEPLRATPDRIAKWCERRTGIGADGVLGTSGSVESQDPIWVSVGAPLAFFFDGFEDGDTLGWSMTVGGLSVR